MAEKEGAQRRLESECRRVWLETQDQMVPAFEEAKKKAFKEGWDTVFHVCYVELGSSLFAMHSLRADVNVEDLSE